MENDNQNIGFIDLIKSCKLDDNPNTLNEYKKQFEIHLFNKTRSLEKTNSFNYSLLNEYFENRISIKEAYNKIFNIIIKPRKPREKRK